MSITCKIDGCSAPVFVQGRSLCSRHYNRLRTTGTTDDGPRARATPQQRLDKYIAKAGPDECWLWTGPKRNTGYGCLSVGGRQGRVVPVHRFVWEAINGKIPSGGPPPHGYVILHTCDNRLCCNPAHLRLGTQADNVRDMDTKGRRVSTPHIGEKHPGAKHTQAQAEAVHQALKEDSGYGACPRIAKRLGVDVTFVRNIKKGLIWQETRTI